VRPSQTARNLHTAIILALGRTSWVSHSLRHGGTATGVETGPGAASSPASWHDGVTMQAARREAVGW
jgi:hypothetical protein